MSPLSRFAIRIGIFAFDVFSGFMILRHIHGYNGKYPPAVLAFANDFSSISFFIAAILLFSKKPLWSLLAQWISLASIMPVLLFKFLLVFSIPYDDAGIHDPNSEGWVVTLIAIFLGGITLGIHSFLSAEIARK